MADLEVPESGDGGCDLFFGGCKGENGDGVCDIRDR